MIDFDLIEQKYSKIINKAKQYMLEIEDPEHSLEHALDVVEFCKMLLSKINTKDIDIDCVVLSCYWHDVGRIKVQDGHELLSAQMLYKELVDNKYTQDFADKCFECVQHHKYDMNPKTTEGLLLKDCDKLAFLGKGRWQECLDKHYDIQEIVMLLPRLRDELLYFEESKNIYDKQIIKIFEMLYKRIYK